MDRAEPGAVPHVRNAAAGEVIAMLEPKKPNNLKMALILGGIAVFFFAMVFIKRIWLS
jgi:hypothetical protein